MPHQDETLGLVLHGLPARPRYGPEPGQGALLPGAQPDGAGLVRRSDQTPDAGPRPGQGAEAQLWRRHRVPAAVGAEKTLEHPGGEAHLPGDRTAKLSEPVGGAHNG